MKIPTFSDREKLEKILSSAKEIIGFIITMSNMKQADIARSIGVDYKTVNRWINEGRKPHPIYYEKLYEFQGIKVCDDSRICYGCGLYCFC